MTNKISKIHTMRVTEEEKQILYFMRNFTWEKYNNNFLCVYSDHYNEGEINGIIAEPFYKSIKYNEELSACFDVAIKKVGKSKLFLELSAYTPFIANVGFQKNINPKNSCYKEYFQPKEILPGYAKYKVNCLYVLDMDRAVIDFKKYLTKNYLEQALTYIKRTSNFDKAPYISIKIKKHEITCFKELLQFIIGFEEDTIHSTNTTEFLLDYQKTTLFECKLKLKFYADILSLTERQKDTFFLDIHALYTEWFSFIFIPDITYSDTLSFSQIIVRKTIAQNIKERLINIKQENAELIKYINFKANKFMNPFTFNFKILEEKLNLAAIINKEKREG